MLTNNLLVVVLLGGDPLHLIIRQRVLFGEERVHVCSGFKLLMVMVVLQLVLGVGMSMKCSQVKLALAIQFLYRLARLINID